VQHGDSETAEGETRAGTCSSTSHANWSDPVYSYSNELKSRDPAV
jgi:hypothetical protein